MTRLETPDDIIWIDAKGETQLRYCDECSEMLALHPERLPVYQHDDLVLCSVCAGQVDKTGDPSVGDRFMHRGFQFRVDEVKNDQVYVVRWPLGADVGDIGTPMRVSLLTWREQMKGALQI